MIQLPQDFDSIFRYIVVVSQRAEQLINGAKGRAETRHAKPTLQARDDVDAGEVDWRVLTQEELDAQRQAMVDQYRAEVGVAADGSPEEPAPIPDVLPTASARSAERTAVDFEDEERDEELQRLQRLLGMATDDDSGIEEDGDDDDDEVSFDSDEELTDDDSEDEEL